MALQKLLLFCIVSKRKFLLVRVLRQWQMCVLSLHVCVCVSNSSTIPSAWHDDSGCLAVIGLVGGTALHIFPAVLRTYWHSLHIHHYNYQPPPPPHTHTHTCTACLKVYHLIFHKQHPSGYYHKTCLKILLKVLDNEHRLDEHAL